MQEQVICRLERARKTTYKARQPEYEWFMQRTQVMSEMTTQKRPVGPRLMPKKVFLLMLRPVGKEMLDRGSMDSDRLEGLGLNDEQLKWCQGINTYKLDQGGVMRRERQL